MKQPLRWCLPTISLVLLATSAASLPRLAPALPGPTGWTDAGNAPLRGITLGPIENARHPGRGYGSSAYQKALEEAVQMGATWVSLTPYGRMFDAQPTGVDLTFEAPFEQNRRDLARAVEQAHGFGLRVILVPHIWVEAGDAHEHLDPGNERAWARYAASYEHFLLTWAKVAEDTGVDLLSTGVEQCSWVTSAVHSPRYRSMIRAVRAVYHGPLTYSAHWYDIDEALVLADIDVISINAFYRLTEQHNADFAELLKGGAMVRDRIRTLAARWHKPVIFTELGYTPRRDTAYDPWTWPETMAAVGIDQVAQAEAYKAILAPLLDEPSFLGFFVWRFFADPDDVSQEAEWGFSPRGKLAELVLRDAFRSRWAADVWQLPGSMPFRTAAVAPGYSRSLWFTLPTTCFLPRSPTPSFFWLFSLPIGGSHASRGFGSHCFSARVISFMRNGTPAFCCFWWPLRPLIIGSPCTSTANSAPAPAKAGCWSPLCSISEPSPILNTQPSPLKPPRPSSPGSVCCRPMPTLGLPTSPCRSESRFSPLKA